MNTLHNTAKYSTQEKLERGLEVALCSNDVLSSGSHSGFYCNEESIDSEIDYLSEILISEFLKRKRYGNKEKKCSHLL